MLFRSFASLLALSVAASSVRAQHVRPVSAISPSDNYGKRCDGKRTDQHWPCFTFNQGDMKSDVTIQMWADNVWPTDSNVYIKDDRYKDFTVSNPDKAFTLNYDNGAMLLYYSGAKNGCYTLTVEAERGYNIGITSDDNREADTATEGDKNLAGRRVDTSPLICSKWSQIYVSRP